MHAPRERRQTRVTWAAGWVMLAFLGCSTGGDGTTLKVAERPAALETIEARALVDGIQHHFTIGVRDTVSPALATIAGGPPRAGRLDAAPVLAPSEVSGWSLRGAGVVAQLATEPAADVELPMRADAPLKLRDRGSSLDLSFSLRGAKPSRLETGGGYAVYRQASSTGGSVVHRVSDVGTEDYVRFDAKPEVSRVTYDVALGKGVAGLRLVADTLEFLDAKGAPRLRVAPPYLVSTDGIRHAARLAVEGCAVDTSTAAPWGRAVVAPGAASCAVHVGWGDDVSYPAVLDPAWTTAGSMSSARIAHSSILLSSGRVLVLGGANASGALASAELFDPTTKTWAATGSMSAGRQGPAAVLLSTSNVLVTGGLSGSNTLKTSEIYDATAGTFSAAASMTGDRFSHAAVVLAAGTVLVTGGYSTASSGQLATTEIYDPTANTWTSTGSLNTARRGFTMTRLASGDVLAVGGVRTDGNSTPIAELYRITSGTWSDTGTLANARAYHSMTVTAGGQVVVQGGYDGTISMSSVESFDPTSATWTALASLGTSRYSHTATALTDGRVLVAGGVTKPTAGASPTDLASVELFDASAWSNVVSLPSAQSSHTAALLSSGDVLVAGGVSSGSYLATARIYSPGTTGTSCTTGTQCGSGFCVSGVCCDTACTGGCSTCTAVGSVGTCTALAAGSAGSPTCSPYVCNGSAQSCLTSCSTDQNCAAGYGCVTGTCQLRTTTTNKTSYAASEDVVVSYTNLPGNANDWIAISTPGSVNGSYVEYAYTGGVANGSKTFRVPTGTWVARSLINNTSALGAESASFTVAGPATTATPAKSSFVTAEPAVINYAGVPGNANDWIAVAATGATAGSYVQYKYLSGATSGAASFSGLAAGSYQATIYLNNTNYPIVASTSFTVGSATLSTDASSYTTSQDVVVSWSGMTTNAGDWIGIAADGAANGSYVQYAYTGGLASGSKTFRVPAGTWRATGYMNNTSVSEGQSAAFTVTGPTPTVTAAAASFPSGSAIAINFANAPGNNADWIGIAAAGAPAGTYLTYAYTQGLASGTKNFASLPAGSYEASLYLNGSNTRLAVSPSFAVASTTPTVSVSSASYTSTTDLTVTWSNLTTFAHDWIAIAADGSAGGSFIEYVYTGGLAAGSTTFRVPPGTWRARAMQNDSSVVLAQSSAFTISGTAPAVTTTKTSYSTSEAVVVNFTNVPGNNHDWVSIALDGSAVGSYVTYKYTGGAVNGLASFTGIPAGTYRARVNLNDANTQLAQTTVTFTVN